MNDTTKKLSKKILFKVASEVANRAKQIAPVDTANLKKDIQVFDDDIDKLEISIGNSTLAPYAKHVHQGTGIHGKHKRRIKPKKAKALQTPHGVFKSIAGQKAQPYLLDAAKDVLKGRKMESIVEGFAEELGKEIVKDIKISMKSL